MNIDLWLFHFQIELATGIFPYGKWETPFEQLKQVVMSEAPRLPENKFSEEFTDFCSKWYVDRLNATSMRIHLYRVFSQTSE